MNKYLIAGLGLAIIFFISDIFIIVKLKKEEKDINKYFELFSMSQEEENKRKLNGIEFGIELFPEENKSVRDSILKYNIEDNFPNKDFDNNVNKYRKLRKTYTQLRYIESLTFENSSDWYNRQFFIKNIKNDSIYFGEIDYAPKTLKYELFINDIEYEYNSDRVFRINLGDTFNIKIKKIEINRDNNSIDTIIRSTNYPYKNKYN